MGFAVYRCGFFIFLFLVLVSWSRFWWHLYKHICKLCMFKLMAPHRSNFTMEVNMWILYSNGDDVIVVNLTYRIREGSGFFFQQWPEVITWLQHNITATNTEMLKESCLEVCKYIIRFDGYFPSLYCHPSFIFVYAVKMRRKRRQLSSFHFFFIS